MGSGDSGYHLGELATSWTLIHEAHDRGDPETARAAQAAFFHRYKGPILRYIQAAVRDDVAAEELHSRFFERFVAGRFHGADPSRGRFRDYLKRALFNLVSDYRESRRVAPARLVSDVAAPAATGGAMEEDEALFKRCYREGLLMRAIQYLEEREQREGRPYATILQLALLDPAPKAADIARALSERTGRRLTEVWVRGIRKEAREAFKRFLIQQIRESLREPSDQLVEEELVELELHDYLKKTLIRQRHSA